MAPLRALVRDCAAALLYAAGLTHPRRAAAGKVVIVTFHRVLPPAQLAVYPSPDIGVTPEELSWFVRFFQRHFHCGSLRETMDHYASPARSLTDRPLLAITFDDGYRDNYLHARPVLAAAGVKATFFVVPGATDSGGVLWADRLGYGLLAALAQAPTAATALLAELGVTAAGGDPRIAVNEAIERTKALGPARVRETVARAEAAAGGPTVPTWDGMMTWDEVRAMAADGHEIGSHSLSHPILPLCDDDSLEAEARESRGVLETRLGAPVDSFCYPNGDHDDRVVGAVERAGYRWAVTTRWGQADHGSPPLRLRRCDMKGASARNRLGGLSQRRLAWRISGLHPGLR